MSSGHQITMTWCNLCTPAYIVLSPKVINRGSKVKDTANRRTQQ